MKEAITALSSKHYTGCHKITEEKDGQTPGKEIWKGKC